LFSRLQRAWLLLPLRLPPHSSMPAPGYRTFEADYGPAGEDLSLGAITGRAGYEFNSFVAVEGEFAVGVDDDSYMPLGLPPSVPGFDVNVSLESEVGAFVVGRLPVPVIGDLFGRIGYANISLEAASTSPFFFGGPEDGIRPRDWRRPGVQRATVSWPA
jgi:hypothetical protein